jgi:hypothetical protein
MEPINNLNPSLVKENIDPNLIEHHSTVPVPEPITKTTQNRMSQKYEPQLGISSTVDSIKTQIPPKNLPKEKPMSARKPYFEFTSTQQNPPQQNTK